MRFQGALPAWLWHLTLPHGMVSIILVGHIFQQTTNHF